jgi:hypothetical protein
MKPEQDAATTRGLFLSDEVFREARASARDREWSAMPARFFLKPFMQYSDGRSFTGMDEVDRGRFIIHPVSFPLPVLVLRIHAPGLM